MKGIVLFYLQQEKPVGRQSKINGDSVGYKFESWDMANNENKFQSV